MAEWELLEERLRPVYGQATFSAAPHLLGLICKGSSLFNSPHGFSDVSANGSLAGWISRAVKSGGLSEELERNLKEFLERFIPPSISKTLNFKSYIHELADVPSHGQCRLRKDTLKYLFDKRSALIREMNGFKEIERKFQWPFEDKYQFPEPLFRLFDQTVFQDFEFLSLS
jgi:hypothetical protein